MAPRRDRQFWQRVALEIERSGASHAQIAARHGVLVSTLRAWLYLLRREQRDQQRTVRILPVEVAAGAPTSAALEIRLPTGEVVAFDVGTDVAYVARLVAALRGAVC